MKLARTALLAVLLTSAMGLIGCSKQNNAVHLSKIRSLESRYSKLEEDHRLLSAVCDATRKKLGQLETERAQLLEQVEQLKLIALECDNVKQQLETRTRERNTAQTQLAQFSADLRGLMARVETAASGAPANGAPGTPVDQVVAIPASMKSE